MESIVRFFGRKIAAIRNRQDRFDHELAVCAIFKNEGRYLEEWLTFHHGVGVGHFYLYNDASDDNCAEILAPWIAKGTVTVISWPTEAQAAAYNHCTRNFRSNARWIAFIDLDEFLFSPTGANLPEVLQGYRDVPAIFVYWVLFGSSGHVDRPDGPVIEAYRQCLDLEAANSDAFDHGTAAERTDYVTGWAKDGKSIVNPRLVRRYSVHMPKKLWTGETLDENRRVARPKDNSIRISYSVFRINHYWSKSIQDLTEKSMRGCICERDRPQPELERWLERERTLNAGVDETILPIWNRVKGRSESRTPASRETS